MHRPTPILFIALALNLAADPRPARSEAQLGEAFGQAWGPAREGGAELGRRQEQGRAARAAEAGASAAHSPCVSRETLVSRFLVAAFTGRVSRTEIEPYQETDALLQAYFIDTCPLVQRGETPVESFVAEARAICAGGCGSGAARRSELWWFQRNTLAQECRGLCGEYGDRLAEAFAPLAEPKAADVPRTFACSPRGSSDLPPSLHFTLRPLSFPDFELQVSLVAEGHPPHEQRSVVKLIQEFDFTDGETVDVYKAELQVVGGSAALRVIRPSNGEPRYEALVRSIGLFSDAGPFAFDCLGLPSPQASRRPD